MHMFLQSGFWSVLVLVMIKSDLVGRVGRKIPGWTNGDGVPRNHHNPPAALEMKGLGMEPEGKTKYVGSLFFISYFNDIIGTCIVFLVFERPMFAAISCFDILILSFPKELIFLRLSQITVKAFAWIH